MKNKEKGIFGLRHKKILGLSLLSLLFRLGIGAVAFAMVTVNWSPSTGVRITSNQPGNQGVPKIIQSGNDFVLFWWDDRNSPIPLENGEIWGQKIDINGISQWVPLNDGIQVANNVVNPGYPNISWRTIQPHLVSDQMNGAITAWEDNVVGQIGYRQVTALGNNIWGTRYIPTTTAGDKLVGIVPSIDPITNLPATWVIWFEQQYISCGSYGGTRIWVQRVDNSTGNMVDPTPILVRDDITVPQQRASWSNSPVVTSDLNNGIVVAWVNLEWTEPNVTPQPDPPPPTPEENLEYLYNILGGGIDGIQKVIEILTTPPHHSPGNRYESIYGQRIDVWGAPVWQNTDTQFISGLKIVYNRPNFQYTTRSELQVIPIPDVLQGVLLAWRDDTSNPLLLGDLYIQRVDGLGNILYTDPAIPGPNSNRYGLPLVQAAGQQYYPFMTYSAGTNPGVVISWSDGRNSVPGAEKYDVYAQKIDPITGISLWGNDIPVCVDPGLHGLTSMAEDGNGGAYILWHDLRFGDPNATIWEMLDQADVYLMHVHDNGNLENPAGIKLTGTGGQGFGDIVADGSRGAIVAWADNRNCSFAANQVCGDVYVQRVVPLTTPLPWPKINTVSYTPMPVKNDARYDVTIGGKNFVFGLTVTYTHTQTGLQIPCYDVNIQPGGASLTCRIAIYRADIGNYDLTVTNPDGQSALKNSALTVQPSAGICAIFKDVRQDEPNQTLTYNIPFENSGGTAIHNITLTEDILPPSLPIWMRHLPPWKLL